MEIDPKSVAHRACRLVLRPVVLMLLRIGITWREFCALAKIVYVDTATEEFGIRGRPTNVSRVSLLTGIARKEVRRLRDVLDQAEPPAPQKTSDATRVLSGWFQDPDFQDPDFQDPEYVGATGKPRPLADVGAYGQFRRTLQALWR